MKLKRKLFSLIGVGAVLIPTMASLVSCSCTYKKEPDEDEPVEPKKDDEYSCPTVSYNGSVVMSPGEGIKTYTIEGFKFSRKLYTGESVKVNIVSQTNDDVEAVPTYSSGSDKMSIKFTVSVKNVNADEKFNFKLTFDFTYKSETKSYKSLDKVFEFQYKGTWLSNRITNSFSVDPYEINLSDGKTTFVVDDLILERQIKKDEGEDLKVTTGNEQYVHCTSWDQEEVGGHYILKLSFDISIPDLYLNHSDILELTFQFTSNDVVKFTQNLNGCGVEYTRDYVEPELKFKGENKTFSALNQVVPEDGKVVTNLSTDINSVLYTNRALKIGEPFNETLSIKLINPSESSKSFEDMIELSNLSLDYSVTSAGVTTSALVYKPKTSVEIPNAYVGEDVPFDIAWKISENNSEWGDDIKSESGVIEGFEYNFTPIWQPKKVEVVGFQEGTSDTINLSDGNWKHVFNHDTDTIKFKVDGEFADQESVFVTLTNTQENDKVVLTQSKAAIIPTENANTSYLSFEISFDDLAKQNPYADHDGQFKLQFAFKVGDNFTYEQAPDENIYKLHFDELLQPIDITIDDQLKVVEGETLKTLTGVWNTGRTFDSLKGLSITNVRSSATASPAPDAIKLLTSPDVPLGISKEGSNIYIYTKIVPSNGYKDETLTFDLVFEFGNETFQVSNVKILYTRFSESIDTFIKARTIPMVLYAQNTTSSTYDSDNECYDPYFDRYFFDMWVGKKVPASETPSSSYEYYLITTKAHRAAFQKFINNHTSAYSNHADHKIHFGMTDSTFVSNYKDSTQTNSFEASSYLRNYLYCDWSAVKWVDDDIKWTNGNNSNIAVARFDFNQSFEDFEGDEQINNPEWEEAYLNKLWQLDNYADVRGYGTINPQPTSPLSTTTDYSKYGFGGFYSSQYNSLSDLSDDPKFTNQTQTVTRWSCDENSNASQLTYSSSALNENKVYYMSDSRTRSVQRISFGRYEYVWVPDYVWSDTGVVSGSPYYSADSKQSGVVDGYNLPSNWSITGSLVVAKKNQESLADNECPVQVIGIYTGWYYTQTWSENSFSFTPYIEVFNNGNENILSKYI